MRSRVERSIQRGRIGGSFRVPETSPSPPRFRGLVLPDRRDRLTLVDVREPAGRPAAGGHRLRRALVRGMTIALLVILGLILTARGYALAPHGGGTPPSLSVAR